MDINNFYSKLTACGDWLQSPLLLAIRLFWGGSFFLTGLGKLEHLDKTIAFFHSLGIPFASFNAVFTGLIELTCGACLFLGLASRLITLPLIGTMLVALATAESQAVRMIFSDPQNFIHRTPFSFLFASLLIFIFGPGILSLDYWLWQKK